MLEDALTNKPSPPAVPAPVSNDCSSPTAKFWCQEIADAKTRHDDFWKVFDQSYKFYTAKKMVLDEKLVSFDYRRVNIWWSIIQTFMPAYYARTPQCEGQERDRLGDIVDAVVMQAQVNATQYQLKEAQNIDRAVLKALEHYLIGGRGVLWERYDAKFEKEAEQFAVKHNELGQPVYLDDNTPIPSDKIVQTSESGEQFLEEQWEQIKEEKALTEVVHYKDYLHSAGRFESEIWWKARRHYLTREELNERFGEEIGKDVPLTHGESDKELLKIQAERHNLKKAEVWEIWSKKHNKVFYICTNYQDKFLEEGEPLIRFPDFWPCSVISATENADSVIPVSDFAIIKDQLLEFERLTTRIHAVIEAIRTNFAYDKLIGDNLEALFQGDLRGIPINNWNQSHQGRGGLSAMMDFAPVDPFINALRVFIDTRDKVKAEIYEQTGNSDLVRGASSPDETASAQQLKSQYLSLRFELRQRTFQAFVQEAVRNKSEVVRQAFTEEAYYQCARIDQLEQQGVPYELILERLKSDNQYKYRVAIQTDSMVALDEQAERAQRVDFLSSIGSFVEQVFPLMKENKEVAPMFFDMVKFAAASYRGGKELKSSIDSGFRALMQKLEQEPAPGEEPQQQDPKIIESETKRYIADLQNQEKQLKLAADREKNFGDTQIRLQEIDLKNRQLSLAVETLQAEIAKMQGEKEIRQIEVEADIQKSNAQLVKEAGDTQQAIITSGKNNLIP